MTDEVEKIERELLATQELVRVIHEILANSEAREHLFIAMKIVRPEHVIPEWRER